ncbi:MAG: class I SAM-dependent methyltransferase [Thermoplasmata archaeon]|jgi:2-polyprenyl-3-methyl-5-hydroxy-6-metoxy-1,4-benzoquinol methylase|nr:class I SAM-dependent methyltransferase [Thermoplasmata archaeon]
MRSDLEEEFERYWTDRIPGLLEYSRLILNSNTDLSFMLNMFLKDKGRCKIADMGTGVGTVAIEVALMGHEVYAIDNNPVMLEAARGLAKNYDADIEFIEDDVQDPKIPHGSFDVIIARNCLWNLTKPSEAYTKWKKLLRPGG